MKTKILFLMFFVFFVSFVAAVPPQQVSDTSLDLVVAYPTTHKLNADYYVHAHVYNVVSEQLVTSGISCYVHLYNHQLEGNEHIFIGEMTQFGAGYNATVSGDLINDSGEYSALVWCNSSTELGFDKYTFQVSESGVPVSTGNYIFLASLVFVLFLVSCFIMYLSTIFNEVGFKIFFLISSLVFIMATLGTGLIVLNDVLSLNGVNNILTALISVTGAIIFIVFIWVLIRQTINALDMYNIKKGRSLGIGSGSGVGGFNTRRAY